MEVVELNPPTGIEHDRIGSCNFLANDSVMKFALEQVSNKVRQRIGFCFRSNTCTIALASSCIFGIDKSDVKSVSLTDGTSSQSVETISVDRVVSFCVLNVSPLGLCKRTLCFLPHFLQPTKRHGLRPCDLKQFRQ